MPTTNPNNIFFADGSTAMSVAAISAAQATSVQEALTDLSTATVIDVSSDLDRDTLFPTPTQGNRVNRTDKGWVERYYGLYEISTNPQGATPAGWYPEAGSRAYCELTVTHTRTWSESLLPAGGTYVEASDALSWHQTSPNPERITPTIAGRYYVGLEGSIPVDGSFMKVLKNNVATTLGCSNGTSLGGGFMSGGGIVRLNGTTDYISVNAYGGNASATGVFRVTLTYLDPLR